MKTLKKIALILSLHLAIPYTECGNVWKQISSLAQQPASVANFTQIWQMLTPYANNTVSISVPVQQNILNTYNTPAATVAKMTQDQIDALNRINVMINGGSMPLRAGVAGPLPAPQPSLWNPVGAPPAGADAPAGAVAAPGLFRSSATGSALNTANEFLQAIHDLGNKPLYNRLFGPDAEFYTQRASEQTMEGAGSTTLLPLLQQCITKLAPAATTIDIRNDCLQRINVSLRALQTILSITLIPNITTDLLGIRAIINTFRKLWNAELNRFENALLPANFVADAPTANAQNPGVSTVDFFNQTMSNLLRYLLFTEDDANYQYMTGETIAIPALNASKFTFIPTQNTARINGILNPASTANLNNTFSATFEFAQALMKQAATTNNLLTTALIRAGSAPDARETLAGKAKALADTALSQAQITALIAAHNTLKAQLERRTNVLLSLAEQGRVNFNTVSIDSANISAYLGNLGFALGTPIGIKITRAGIFVEAFGPLGLEQAYTTSTSIPNTSSIPGLARLIGPIKEKALACLRVDLLPLLKRFHDASVALQKLTTSRVSNVTVVVNNIGLDFDHYDTWPATLPTPVNGRAGTMTITFS